MNRLIGSLIVLTCLISSTTFSQRALKKLKAGKYGNAYLTLSSEAKLPINLSVDGIKKNKYLIIHNGEEKIELKTYRSFKDSLIFTFPDFDSELRFKVFKDSLKGFWINHNKANNYRIPFVAHYGEVFSPVIPEGNHELYTKYKITMSPNTENSDETMGIFSSLDYGDLRATIRTTTGDYRYLAGNRSGDKFTISAFDGTHAFLLIGEIEENKLNGKFYSGKHFSTDFIGEYAPNFELPNPDSLTSMKNGEKTIKFELKDINGSTFTFPNENFKNKVVIIQIMGTWCPNCMDETIFLKELYSTYHAQGLEIISVGYENAPNFAGQAAKIKKLKERHQLPFTFLVGGEASKALASQQFAALNHIMSFPTSIIIDKNGNVARIHTGFNGPGTEQVYEDFKNEMNLFIQGLLK